MGECFDTITNGSRKNLLGLLVEQKSFLRLLWSQPHRKEKIYIVYYTLGHRGSYLGIPEFTFHLDSRRSDPGARDAMVENKGRHLIVKVLRDCWRT